MGKKKREHVVFDQMLKQKQSIPFAKVNRTEGRMGKKKGKQKNESNHKKYG